MAAIKSPDAVITGAFIVVGVDAGAEKERSHPPSILMFLLRFSSKGSLMAGNQAA